MRHHSATPLVVAAAALASTWLLGAGEWIVGRDLDQLDQPLNGSVVVQFLLLFPAALTSAWRRLRPGRVPQLAGTVVSALALLVLGYAVAVTVSAYL